MNDQSRRAPPLPRAGMATTGRRVEESGIKESAQIPNLIIAETVRDSTVVPPSGARARHPRIERGASEKVETAHLQIDRALGLVGRALGEVQRRVLGVGAREVVVGSGSAHRWREGDRRGLRTLAARSMCSSDGRSDRMPATLHRYSEGEW